jgi:hypothetical protein
MIGSSLSVPPVDGPRSFEAQPGASSLAATHDFVQSVVFQASWETGIFKGGGFFLCFTLLSYSLMEIWFDLLSPGPWHCTQRNTSNNSVSRRPFKKRVPMFQKKSASHHPDLLVGFARLDAVCVAYPMTAMEETIHHFKELLSSSNYFWDLANWYQNKFSHTNAIRDLQ